MFSKTCEYAIKIMIYISSQYEKRGVRLGLEEISQAIDSPKAFTAKILQQLARGGLLDSLRGRTGGFTMPEGRTVTLADIVSATDGDGLMKGCVLGFKECSDKHPCAVHYKFKSIRDHLSQTLVSTSLEELKQEMEQRPVHLTMK